MKASDLFVECLKNEGVEYIFGVPGEENLDFLESLRTSSIQFIPTRHEQVAGFMAATYGRLTGKTGVCLSTLGPGATNFVTPAAFAQLGGMPMLMITGQKPIKKSKQGHFQIIDTVEIMRPVTKMTELIGNGNRIPSLIRNAFKKAEEERPGAVHLVLPEDIAAEEVEGAPFPRPEKVRRPIAEEKAIEEAISLIQQAKHPLLLIGAGANRKLTAKMLREFVDATSIPFFNTQMGKGVIDERHPLYIGTAALSSKDYLHCAIERADLIINVGHDVIEKPPFIMEKNGIKVIHMNFYSASIDDVYFPHLEVIGDIANAIWQLKEKVKKQAHWDFSYFLKIKEYIHQHIEKPLKNNDFPLIPQRIVHEIRQILPEDGIVSLDNGVYKLWFARNYPAYAPNTLLLDNALATMGAGLPGAMMAKMLFPNKKVIAVCGDGGFMMNSQDLETAVRLKLDLVVLILNDSGYGMISWKQKGMGFSDFGLDFGNPDFVKYAESYGAQGHRISKENSLTSILEACLSSSGVHIIDVPVDYSPNHEVLTKELAEKTCVV